MIIQASRQQRIQWDGRVTQVEQARSCEHRDGTVSIWWETVRYPVDLSGGLLYAMGRPATREPARQAIEALERLADGMVEQYQAGYYSRGTWLLSPVVKIEWSGSDIMVARRARETSAFWTSVAWHRSFRLACRDGLGYLLALSGDCPLAGLVDRLEGLVEQAADRLREVA